MTPVCLSAAWALAFLVAGQDSAAQTSAGIRSRIEPAGTLRADHADLVVTVSVSGQPLQGATLTVEVPRGLRVARQSHTSGAPAPGDSLLAIPLPQTSTSITETLRLTADPGLLARGDHTLVLQLLSAGGASVLESEEVKLAYAPVQPAWEFVLTGLLGIVIGWLVRLVLQVQKTITPPAPEPAKDGPVTVFVKSYYYWVDLAVTAVIGVVVLATMLKDGMPPDAGALIYQSFAIGFGLGLLTNSDLITRTKAG
jgi:hypothetical protein